MIPEHAARPLEQLKVTPNLPSWAYSVMSNQKLVDEHGQSWRGDIYFTVPMYNASISMPDEEDE